MLNRMFIDIKNVPILTFTEIIVIKVNIFWLKVKLTGSDFTVKILTVLLEYRLIDYFLNNFS